MAGLLGLAVLHSHIIKDQQIYIYQNLLLSYFFGWLFTTSFSRLDALYVVFPDPFR